MKSGPARIYENIFEVLTNGAEKLIKPEQSRKQVAVMEECHRQNSLPPRDQSIPFRL